MSLDEEAGISSPSTVRRIGLEASRSIDEKTRNGFVAKYLSGAFILDIGYRGYAKDVQPVVAQAIGVELDYPGYDGRTLPFESKTQDAVFASHCLEHIDDYQTALREWYRVLKIGGFMVIAVPHHFLYERRTHMPSKWNADHKRFYTPATLMAEIEASLAPNTYRLRHLIDNDMYYDYSVPPDFHAGGCYEVELVIERISPPTWVFEEPPAEESRVLPEVSPEQVDAGKHHELDESSIEITAAPFDSACANSPLEAPHASKYGVVSSSAIDDDASLVIPKSPAPKLSVFWRVLSKYRDLRANSEHIASAINESSTELIRQFREQQQLIKEQMVALEAARNEVKEARRDLNQIAAELQAKQESTMSQLASSISGTILDKVVKDLVASSQDSVERHNATLSSLGEMTNIFSSGIREAVARIGDQTRCIESLSLNKRERARLYPSSEWTAEVTSRVRANLSLLTPVGIRGIQKVRVGREYDGGYVMLDHFEHIGAALSLGIADDASWDLDVAERGIPVMQFDPSIEASPESHERFDFSQLRVAAEDGDQTISLQTIVSTRLRPDIGRLLLKIDIEGDEWEVLQATDEQVLAQFDQIVCEFHELNHLANEGFANRAHEVLTKLARTHVVYHVHGNNCGDFVNVGNVVLPQTLEVSFALRAGYETSDTAVLFPTELDRPNEPGRADLYLGSFRF